MQIQLTERFYDKVLGFYYQRDNTQTMFYTYDHKAVVRPGNFTGELVFEEVVADALNQSVPVKKISVDTDASNDLYFDTEKFEVIDKSPSNLGKSCQCACAKESKPESDSILFDLVEELEGKTINISEGSDLRQIFERAKTYVAHKKFETMSLDEKIFTIAKTHVENDSISNMLPRILEVLNDANVFSIAHQIINERSLASDDCCRNSLATEILERIGEIRNESNS